MKNRVLPIAMAFSLLMGLKNSQAQADTDAGLLQKNKAAIGAGYAFSSWKNYWEGTLKRNNENLGTVSANTYHISAGYGICNKLNVGANAAYVSTKASAGTLHGFMGVQDLSLFLKWKPIEKKWQKQALSLLAVVGASVPLNNYVVDFFPLSIGLHCKTISGRAIVNYGYKNWYATGSAAYIVRGNITLDRTAYYTTTLHLTNEVEIPNAANYNMRLGYRTKQFGAVAILDNYTTLGGFDITRNNSPFPSNKINTTSIGLQLSYGFFSNKNIYLAAGASTTVAGRNAGQTTSYNGGLHYIFSCGPVSKKQ